jgi:hypothetical protein
MNLEDLPLMPVPTDLSDEAVVAIIDLLNELIRTLERQYTGQILRYYQTQPRQPDLWD